MKKHQPALLGGLFIGILASLPVVNLLNCCCLWVITGGMLTVYLQQQRQAEPISTGDAVIGGLLAGVVGAIIAAAGAWIQTRLAGPVMQDQLQRAFEQMQELPPEARDVMQRLMSGNNLVVLAAAIYLPVYAVFGMLGALLGTAFFRKKPTAMPPQSSAPPMIL